MSQNLPNIVKVTKLNYVAYSKFIEESVSFSYLSTVKYSSPPSDFEEKTFFNWLQAEELYILNRNNKSIGIVVLHSSEMDEETLVTFTTFLHPRVCKMAAISLLKGAVCLASIYSVINKARSFSTYIYHAIMFSTIRNIFNNVRVLKLSSLTQFCVVSVDHLTLDSLKQLLTSLFEEDISEYLEMF